VNRLPPPSPAEHRSAGDGYLVVEWAGPAEVFERSLPYLLEFGCLGTAETGEGRQLCYFPAGRDPEYLVRSLRGHLPEISAGSVHFLPRQDWLSLWREGFDGFPLGERFYVLPSWKPAPQTERLVLRIDPERAFGTGTHETTRLCLRLLERYVRAGMRAVDAGAGTGILAMAAARLGASQVTALECDPEAAACTRANVRRNGLSERIQVLGSAIAETEVAPVDFVVANLSQPTLLMELARLASWLRPGGVLVLSGLLVDQGESIAAHAGPALTLRERAEDGEWLALVFEKK
jgi:ribosomal protein L11 methyltransferase